MKRIKIAYIIDQLNIGGTEKQLLTTIQNLDNSAFEPYLICLRTTEYWEQLSIGCHKKVMRVDSLASWDGVKKLFQFVGYLKREKIDIVQTFFFDSTFFGVLAARMAGVKRILSSRRDMGFWYTPVTLLTLFFINKITHRIVVNSEAIKQNVHLKEHVSKEKIDVIYNGIDLKPFSVRHDAGEIRQELDIPSENKVVGIVANLNRQVKRVDLFIEAAAQVLKLKQNISFVIVGEGGWRGVLEKQADRLGISQKIHFAGSKNNVIPYLQLFDVSVLTSESEGFSNSIIEYMATGTPIVCFDVGGNSEIIENYENGFLCLPYSIDDVSEKVSYLLNNEDLCQRISIFNRRKVVRFDWSEIIRIYENYLIQILKNGKNYDLYNNTSKE